MEKKKTGRPSKLTDEAIEKARHYINGGYDELGHVVPTVPGLAGVLSVSKSTLYHWKDAQPEKFLDVLEQLMDKQHLVLLRGGLSGEFNAAICKLMLAKHGYHARREISGPEGESLQVNIVKFSDSVAAPNSTKAESEKETQWIVHGDKVGKPTDES